MRLLIFKVNQLGDNVVFLPVAQELRRRFPAWELAIFTSPLAEALYEGVVPRADRRFAVPTARFNGSWRRPADLLRLWRRAAGYGPDACLLADDQANVAYLLAFLSGATRRVALRRPFIKVGALATRRLPEIPGEKVARTNWRIAGSLVEELGGVGHWPADPPPPDLSHLLAPGDGPARGDRCRVVIHAGASRSYQRWFPERYAALADRLAARNGTDVLWIDTPLPGDPPRLSPAVARVATPTLRDLVRLLAGADLFVGNNSGPMHLANALGRPCVILNGPTAYGWDPPWHAERMLMLRDESLSCLPCDSDGHAAQECRRLADPMACMKFWTVDAVLERCVDWARRWQEIPATPATIP